MILLSLFLTKTFWGNVRMGDVTGQVGRKCSLGVAVITFFLSAFQKTLLQHAVDTFTTVILLPSHIVTAFIEPICAEKNLYLLQQTNRINYCVHSDKKL